MAVWIVVGAAGGGEGSPTLEGSLGTPRDEAGPGPNPEVEDRVVGSRRAGGCLGERGPLL